MKAIEKGTCPSYVYIDTFLYICFCTSIYMQANSVFDLSHSSVSFYLDNVLDSGSQTYYKVISLSVMPRGPLSNMVAVRRFPPLSEFQTASPWDTHGSMCKYVLMRYPERGASSVSNLMSQEDIPSLLGYLMSNGYQVQTDLSRLIQDQGLHSGGGDFSRKFICFASYSSWCAIMMSGILCICIIIT